MEIVHFKSTFSSAFSGAVPRASNGSNSTTIVGFFDPAKLLIIELSAITTSSGVPSATSHDTTFTCNKSIPTGARNFSVANNRCFVNDVRCASNASGDNSTDVNVQKLGLTKSASVPNTVKDSAGCLPKLETPLLPAAS